MAARTKDPRAKSQYQPTARETDIISRYEKSSVGRSPRLKSIESGDRSHLVPEHPDERTGYILLMEALGTTDPDFFGLLYRQSAAVEGQV